MDVSATTQQSSVIVGPGWGTAPDGQAHRSALAWSIDIDLDLGERRSSHREALIADSLTSWLRPPIGALQLPRKRRIVRVAPGGAGDAHAFRLSVLLAATTSTATITDDRLRHTSRWLQDALTRSAVGTTAAPPPAGVQLLGARPRTAPPGLSRPLAHDVGEVLGAACQLLGEWAGETVAPEVAIAVSRGQPAIECRDARGLHRRAAALWIATIRYDRRVALSRSGWSDAHAKRLAWAGFHDGLYPSMCSWAADAYGRDRPV